MKKLILLWELIKGNRTLYIGAFLCVCLTTIVSFISPLVIKVAIDNIIGGKPIQPDTILYTVSQYLGGEIFLKERLWVFALILLVLIIIESIFTFLKGKWTAVASESMALTLREKLYDHLQHLPYKFHATAETGDLIQRCTSDTDTIRRFLSVQLIEIGRAVIMIGSVIPIMLSMNVKLTFVAMSAIPFIFAFAVIFFLKVKSAFKLADEADGALSTMIQENLTGIRIVKAFARQDYEIDKFKGKNADYRDKVYKLIKILALYWSTSDLLCLIQIAMVLVIGSIWSIQGYISLGTVVAFSAYEGRLLWPVRQMGRVLTDLGKTLVSLTRIREILDAPREVVEGLEPSEQLKGKIVFKDLNFAYQEGKEILKGIDLEIKPGQIVAILGTTGSGKSTLVNLIPRLYDYENGSITIDDYELNTLNRKWLRAQVGIVLQEPFLFSKTLKDNIKLGNSEALDEDVYQASKVACVHDVIEAFEQGYETAVGEKGVTLSGGQKQRVAMARAIIKNPSILIFDDSLSAVDNETDKKIQEALKARKGFATTIIISHRITTLAQADQIVVLEHGVITQKGTHTELLQQDGLYQRFWNIQNDLQLDLEKELTEKDFTLQNTEETVLQETLIG